MSTNGFVNPQLNMIYNNYMQRFPEATQQQFGMYLRRNNPDLMQQFMRGVNNTNMGKTAARIMGRGLKAIGPIGDILYYATLPMRRDEILNEYGLQMDNNGNLYGRF